MDAQKGTSSSSLSCLLKEMIYTQLYIHTENKVSSKQWSKWFLWSSPINYIICFNYVMVCLIIIKILMVAVTFNTAWETKSEGRQQPIFGPVYTVQQSWLWPLTHWPIRPSFCLCSLPPSIFFISLRFV